VFLNLLIIVAYTLVVSNLMTHKENKILIYILMSQKFTYSSLENT